MERSVRAALAEDLAASFLRGNVVAGEVLSTLDDDAAAAIVRIRRALQATENDWKALRTARLLLQLGDTSPLVVARIERSFHAKPKAALELLASLGKRGLPKLLEALDSETTGVAVHAAALLARSEGGPQVLTALGRRLSDPRPELRTASFCRLDDSRLFRVLAQSYGHKRSRSLSSPSTG